MPKGTKYETSNEELVRRSQAGDRRALASLVAQNQGLLWSVAKRYAHRCTSMGVEDLVAEGVFGILQAVKMFDVSFEAKFSTYAMQWIRAKIGRAAALDSTRMTLPQRSRLVYLLDKFTRRVDEKVAHEDVTRHQAHLEVKKEFGLSDGLFDDLESFSRARYLSSLDAPLFDDDSTLHDITGEGGEGLDVAEGSVDSALIRERIDQFRGKLDEREVAVLDGRLLSDHKTLDDIGEEFDLCRERVRQIEDKLKKKLRNVLTTKKNGEWALRRMRAPVAVRDEEEREALAEFAAKRPGRRPKAKPSGVVLLGEPRKVGRPKKVRPVAPPPPPKPAPMTLEQAVAQKEKLRVQALRAREALRAAEREEARRVLDAEPRGWVVQKLLAVSPEEVLARFNYATGECFACGKWVPPMDQRQHTLGHDQALLGLASDF